jgi:hypothetical protein
MSDMAGGLGSRLGGVFSGRAQWELPRYKADRADSTTGVIRGNRRDPAQSHSNFKEKSRLIFLPNYGCLESLSGQSSMPIGL